MKTVYSSTDEVAHAWANKRSSYGRNSTSSVSFNDDVFLSYRTIIARRYATPTGDVFHLSQIKYSITTTRHQGELGYAVRNHGVAYEVSALSWEECVRIYEGALERATLKAQTANVRNRLVYENRALEAWRQLQRDSMAFSAVGIAAPMPADPAGAFTPERLQELRAAKERQEIAAREALKAQERKAQRAFNKQLKEWRAGGADRFHSGGFGIYLRLSSDGKRIQTSHGAEVPVVVASEVWGVCRLARATQTARELGTKLGVYTFKNVDTDGNITVGCHQIKYEELQQMAKLLGYYPATTTPKEGGA